MIPAVSPAPDGDAVHAPAPDTPQSALVHLHRVHRPVLLAYVTRLVKGDVHLAEDIVQETMVRAWKHPDARTADGRWSRGWLFTVARRILIDHVRAVEARPAEQSEEWIEHVALTGDEVDRMLDGKEVRAALGALPERLRTVLVEVYYQERSVAEAAEILDVPAGTVKSRTFHAIRALREALIERGFVFSPRTTARNEPSNVNRKP